MAICDVTNSDHVSLQVEHDGLAGAQKAWKEKESLQHEAIDSCQEAWLMGDLGVTKGVPLPSNTAQKPSISN